LIDGRQLALRRKFNNTSAAPDDDAPQRELPFARCQM
jgi:hypothetical protein